MAKKLAIVGFSHHTMRMVEKFFDKKDWEIWGINNLHQTFPELLDKATRWFQIHHMDYLMYQRDWDESRFESLKTAKIPIYMINQHKDFPTSIEYPLRKVLDEFGRRYFSDSFCWLMALAIMEKFKEIHLYGIDLSDDYEYQRERSALEYYIGIARGKGIRIFIPAEADIMKHAVLYGFEHDDTFVKNLTLKRKNFEEQRDEHEQQYREWRDKKNRAAGALAYIQHESKDSEDELDKWYESCQIQEGLKWASWQQFKGACDAFRLIQQSWFNRTEQLIEESEVG